MGTELLVEDSLDFGQKLIAELFRDGFDVAVALWARASEEGRWFLYIGSRSVGPESIGGAYRALSACLSRIPDSEIGISEVKLVPAASPLAREAMAVRDRYYGRAPKPYRGKRLANLGIEEAYIYPPLPAPPPVQGVEMRKLRKDVAQVGRPKDFALSQEEDATVAHLTAQGVSPQQAEEWVRKKREKQRPPIPAGSVVKAWVAAAWGERPEDDPNPLLMVEGPDGARGLAFKEDTEPA